VAAASPSGVNLSRVVEMWTAAVKAGRAGKEAALHAALGILSSPSPPSANAPTGLHFMSSGRWMLVDGKCFNAAVLRASSLLQHRRNNCLELDVSEDQH
jgi:hypothetical protein